MYWNGTERNGASESTCCSRCFKFYVVVVVDVVVWLLVGGHLEVGVYFYYIFCGCTIKTKDMAMLG